MSTAPVALLAALRSAGSMPPFDEALAWIEAHGATDPALLEALVIGAIVSSNPATRDLAVFECARDALLRWATKGPEAAAALVDLCLRFAQRRLEAEDGWAATRYAAIARELFRIVPAEARAALAAPHLAALDAWLTVAERSMAAPKRGDLWVWAVFLLALGPEARTPRAQQLFLRPVLGGADPEAVPLAELVEPALGIPALLPELVDHVAKMPPDALNGHGHPNNVEGYPRASALWRVMTRWTSAESVAEAMPPLSPSTRLSFADFLRTVLAQASEADAARMSASPVLHEVLRTLVKGAPDEPRLERLRRIGVRVGALERAAVGKMPELPSALPATLAEVSALAERLGVNPSPEHPSHVRSMLGRLLETIRADGGAPPLAALDRGDHTDLDYWIKLHQRQGSPSPATPPRGDLRPLLPLRKPIVLGRAEVQDWYFLDPRLRTTEGSCPVLRYSHDRALVFDVVAPSVASFLAWELLCLWADGEGSRALIAGLEPAPLSASTLVRARAGRRPSPKRT